MPRGKRAPRPKASTTPIPSNDEPAGSDADMSPKRPRASRDETPCPSSLSKRRMTSPPEPESSGLELKITSLQSKHEALEAELATVKDRLTAVESRLPPIGNETAPVSVEDTPKALGVGHPAKKEDDFAASDPNVPDQASRETIERTPADIFMSVGRDPEQVRRWNHMFLFGDQGPEYFSEVQWPQLRSRVAGFCTDTFPRYLPLDRIKSGDKAWMESWAPHYEEYVRKYNGDKRISTFYEACVWRILCEELFSNHCAGKWRKGAWADFGSVLRHLLPDVKPNDNEFTVAFFHWKRNSVRMLHMSDTRGHCDRERLRAVVYNRVKVMIRRPESQEESALVEKRLLSLVDYAIEVDLHMLASLQNVAISMADPETDQSHGFTYHEASSSMAHAHTRFSGEPAHDGRPVAFIAAPLLQRHGRLRTCRRIGAGLVENFLTDIYACDYQAGEVVAPMRVMLEFAPEEKPSTPWLLGRPG